MSFISRYEVVTKGASRTTWRRHHENRGRRGPLGQLAAPPASTHLPGEVTSSGPSQAIKVFLSISCLVGSGHNLARCQQELQMTGRRRHASPHVTIHHVTVSNVALATLPSPSGKHRCCTKRAGIVFFLMC